GVPGAVLRSRVAALPWMVSDCETAGSAAVSRYTHSGARLSVAPSLAPEMPAASAAALHGTSTVPGAAGAACAAAGLTASAASTTAAPAAGLNTFRCIHPPPMEPGTVSPV